MSKIRCYYSSDELIREKYQKKGVIFLFYIFEWSLKFLFIMIMTIFKIFNVIKQTDYFFMHYPVFLLGV